MKKYIILFILFTSFLSASEEFIYQAYPAWIDFKSILDPHGESYSAPLMAEGQQYRVVYTCSPKIQRVVEVALYNHTMKLATASIAWSERTGNLREVLVKDRTGRRLFQHTIRERKDGRFSAHVIDHQGNEHRYFYDAKRRPVREIATWPTGRMVLRVWDYDAHRECVQFFESGDLMYEEETERVNDSTTRKKLKAYRNGALSSCDTVEWQRDAKALSSLTRLGRLGSRAEVRYETGADGKITKKRKPDGTEIIYQYSAANVVERVFSSDGTIDYQVRYDAAGNISEIRDRVSGILHTRRFHENGRLIEETIAGKRMLFLEEGELKRTIFPDESSVSYSKETIRRENAQNELLYEEKLEPPAFGQERAIAAETECEFDALQHLITKNGKIVERDEFGNSTRIGSTHIRYDINGRVISKELDGVLYCYAYDALDRLITVHKGRETALRLTYDFFGRCIKSESEREVLYFCYSGDEEIAAVDESGKVVQLKLSAPSFFTRLVELNGTPYRASCNNQGTVLGLFDCTTQMPFEEYSYTSTGEERRAGGISQNPWRFTGHRVLEEANLVVYPYRLYDPSIVRWMTEDPLKFLDGPNATRVARNDPLGLFELQIDFSKMYQDAQMAFSRMCQKAVQTVTFAQHQLEWLFEARTRFEDVAFQLMSKTFWTLLGYNPDSNVAGVTSGKEASPKVRITLINGMLNAHSHVVDAAELISQLHGNTAIHYLYASSGGFTADVLRGFFSKTGFYTPQAALLVTTWRSLIEEMGGINSQGTIVHYAHSLGGSDTARALQELTPNERKMIRVVTFGSATMIEREAADRVHNYVSNRDPVPLADPVNYVAGWRGKKPEVVFLPSETLFDHSIVGITYKKTLEELGLQFQNDFLKSKTSKNGFVVKGLDAAPPKELPAPKQWRIRAALRDKNSYRMGRYFARNIQTEKAFVEVEKAVKTAGGSQVRRAASACRAILNLQQDLGITAGELFQLCLYIEMRMKEKIENKKFQIEAKKSHLARDVEYYPETKSTFIHLAAKGVKKVGTGCHKSVTKSILYSSLKPEIVANCEAPIGDIDEMKATRALQGERGVVEGRAFILRKKKINMLMRLYNANTVDFISKKKSQNFTIQEKIGIATDLLYGLSAIHRRGYLHRDLHMGNAIIDISPGRKITAALIDFGKTIKKQKAYGEAVQGYPPCTAPEGFFLHLLKPDDYQATDVYALGCTLYTLHFGKRPPWFGLGYFRHMKLCNIQTRQDQEALIKLNQETVGARRDALLAKSELTLDEKFECLILQMMHVNPGKRGTAEALRAQMEQLQR